MAKTAVISGAAGLIGSECVRYFSDNFTCVGIDNDMRKEFFGEDGSTKWNLRALQKAVPNYVHCSADIRNVVSLEQVFSKYEGDIELVIHTAAQPSHDWAARDPFTDFSVNATGTLNMLEMTRKYCPKACFIFTSTNKVYGDNPNLLPLVERETRWEVDPGHPYAERGIDESMSLDHCMHSVFGASKVAADVMAQEYGRYFGLNTGIFRGGCLTGPGHSGVELHGFLSYLMICAVEKRPYTIYGYKGKQVRDNIHSHDLVLAFDAFRRSPRCGEAYNMGGSRRNHCSMLEAISRCEEISGNRMSVRLVSDNRAGDHIWYVSDVSKFQEHYPDWRYTKSLEDTLLEIYESVIERKG